MIYSVLGGAATLQRANLSVVSDFTLALDGALVSQDLCISVLPRNPEPAQQSDVIKGSDWHSHDYSKYNISGVGFKERMTLHGREVEITIADGNSIKGLDEACVKVHGRNSVRKDVSVTLTEELKILLQINDGKITLRFIPALCNYFDSVVVEKSSREHSMIAAKFRLELVPQQLEPLVVAAHAAFRLVNGFPEEDKIGSLEDFGNLFMCDSTRLKLYTLENTSAGISRSFYGSQVNSKNIAACVAHCWSLSGICIPTLLSKD